MPVYRDQVDSPRVQCNYSRSSYAIPCLSHISLILPRVLQWVYTLSSRPLYSFTGQIWAGKMSSIIHDGGNFTFIYCCEEFLPTQWICATSLVARARYRNRARLERYIAPALQKFVGRNGRGAVHPGWYFFEELGHFLDRNRLILAMYPNISLDQIYIS